MSNTRKHNGHDQPINGFSELGDLLSDPEATADWHHTQATERRAQRVIVVSRYLDI